MSVVPSGQRTWIVTVPVARPKSMITGKDMEIRWGANWDDDLGGTAENGHKDPMLKGIEDETAVAELRWLELSEQIEAIEQSEAE